MSLICSDNIYAKELVVLPLFCSGIVPIQNPYTFFNFISIRMKLSADELLLRKERMKDVKAFIEKLIRDNELWRFYKTKEWITLREKILKENNYECAECKKRGRITRYDVKPDGTKVLISTVHHVQFVRKHPELALSRYYFYKGKRYDNLIPVCKACHNRLHPEKNKNNRNPDKFFNEERW